MRTLLTIVVLIALVLLSCESRPKATRPITSAPADAINDPLARAGVRMEFIKDAVPENKPVVKQADAAKSDMGEARTAVDLLQDAHQREVDQLGKVIDKLEKDLASAQSDEEKLYRRRMFWMKTGCVLGIAGGLVSCIWFGMAGVIVALAMVSTLVAIAADKFIDDWAEPIGGGALAVLAIMVLWRLYQSHKSNKELATTGRVLLQKAQALTQDGKVVPEVAEELNDIQGSFTKKLVNKFNSLKRRET